jgi:hypothetical protein
MASDFYQMVVPVDNFFLKGLADLQVGRVMFRTTSAVLPGMKDHIPKAMAASPYSPKQRRELTKTFDETITRAYGGAPTCGIVTIMTNLTELRAQIKSTQDYLEELPNVQAGSLSQGERAQLQRMAQNTHIDQSQQQDSEQDRLLEVAEASVEDALDLMRCYTHILFGRDARAYIGLWGSVPSQTRPAFGSNAIGDYTLRLQRVGKFFEFDMTPPRLATLQREHAFNELNGALGKEADARSGLEGVVIGAMWRLARGVVAADPAEKFLNLVIALESLMIEKNERGSKFDKMSSRLATFMENDASKRPPLAAWARGIYTRRNEHAHAAAREAPVQEVIQLEAYAVGAFLKLAKNFGTWQDHSDFIRWVGTT